MWKRNEGEAGYAWYRNGTCLAAMPTATWRVEDCLTNRIEATVEKLAEMRILFDVWRERTDQIWQDNDELWEFSSPEHTWAQLQGRSGIAWLRNGKLIAAHASKIN